MAKVIASVFNFKKSTDIIEDLNSLKVERQKDAVKKIISAMTTGRDVSKLFPQVVKCILTPDLELKKLVYLYIINYARVKPVETLLAVNAFKKDASDLNNNPLTRALAVRTMGCLGVDQIMQFLCDPLKDALNDKDPYVRKTGALCVAKIYDINSQLVEEQFGFIERIQIMLDEESNAMVLANCISALMEISTTKGKSIINIDWKRCRHLMAALHENNEWTQTYLLEGISRYNPQKQDEINEIIERVLPCVSHSNSGVVLSSIKILVKLLDLVENPEIIRTVCKKITPSLVTLMSNEPEIQYVALKNINILIQKRPIIFEKDVKLFFANFTEPLYIKLEKLNILYKLVTMNNIDMVLNELKEYSSDVDIKFVRKSVKLIGQCAIKLEKAAQRCVETLVELVKTQVGFVIEEAIIALRDIFRRYPNTFEGAMSIVNENLRSLDDSQAKAALIWIIGEYSDRIDGAESQLEKFIDNLKEEPYIVQLNILNSATKTFLKCQTEESYNILNTIFDYCTKECEDPDIRNRGYIYFRLMSIDPVLASKIIITEKPRISEDVSGFEEILLDKLLDNLGTLATIYGKPPELFVKKTKNKYFDEDEEGEYEESTFNVEGDEDNKNDNYNNNSNKNVKIEQKNDEESDSDENNDDNNDENNNNDDENNNNNNNNQEDIAKKNQAAINLLDIDNIFGGGDNQNNNNMNNNNMNQQQQTQNQNDVLDIFGSSNNINNNSINQNTMNSNNGMSDIFSSMNSMNIGNQIQNIRIPKMVVISEQTNGVMNPNKGLELEASVYRQNSSLFLQLVFNNKSSGTTISNFILQFNKNYFGLTVDANCLNGLMIQQGQTIEKIVPLSIGQCDNTKIPQNNPPYTIQTGLRCSLNEYYFVIPVMLCVLFEPTINLPTSEQYQNMFMSIPNTPESGMVIDNLYQKYSTLNGIIDRFKNNYLYFISKNDGQNGCVQLYFYGKLTNNKNILVGIIFNPSNPSFCNVMCKTDTNCLISFVLHAVKFMLTCDF